MKINFSSIQNPTMLSPTAHVVTGTLPSGELVKVERYLRGWDVHLKITLDDVVWHDSQVEADEITAVSILRESAMMLQYNQQDEKRALIHAHAKKWLRLDQTEK